MFSGLTTLQAWVLLFLGVGSLALQLYAFVDAARQRADAFPAAGKLTKRIWLLILGVAVALGFVLFSQDPLNFLNILAVVAAGVYMADVRPAVKNMSSGGYNNNW